MASKASLQSRYDLLTRWCAKYQDTFVPLLPRAVLAYVFAPTGWGKLHDLEPIVEYFASLGIVFPSLMAPFVSTIELVGGIAIALGAFSRLFSLLLCGVMMVALFSAKPEALASFDELIQTSEFLYAVLLVWLAAVGPGRYSLDQKMKWDRNV